MRSRAVVLKVLEFRVLRLRDLEVYFAGDACGVCGLHSVHCNHLCCTHLAYWFFF